MNSYSPSQVIEFSRCQRKWFFNKILKYPQREGKSAALGAHIHNQLEKYFKERLEVEHPAARASLAHLPDPAPGEGLEAEMWLHIETNSQIEYRGKVDLIDLRDPDQITVYDHKSMGTFDYAKTSRELAFDIQVISYGYMALELHAPKATTVRIVHNQIPTQIAAPPRKEEVTLQAWEVRDRFKNRVLPVITDMEVVRHQEHVKNVEPNYDACNDFGGCPYKSQCALADRGVEVMPFASHKVSINLSDDVELEIKKEKQPMRLAENFLDTLYIDCLPTGEDAPTHLAEMLAPMLSEICEMAGVSDWRLIEYGKGAGEIAAALRSTTLLPSTIYIDSSLPTAKIALEVLIPLAVRIVRGVR